MGLNDYYPLPSTLDFIKNNLILSAKEGEFKMQNPFLISDRIYLRQVVREDAENYYHWLNDQENTKWMQRGIYPTSIDDCKDYIESMQGKDGMHLAIVRKAEYVEGILKNPLREEKHIGNITLLNIHPTFRSAEISIIVGDKQSRGNGYGTEAIKLLVNHAFTRMNLNRLQAGTVINNFGSMKAFLKAGFYFEGISRQAYYCEGEYQDVQIMSILKEEWRKGNGST